MVASLGDTNKCLIFENHGLLTGGATVLKGGWRWKGGRGDWLNLICVFVCVCLWLILLPPPTPVCDQVEEAFWRMYSLDKACQVQVCSQTTGGNWGLIVGVR